MTAPVVVDASGRLVLVREISSPNGVAETDWADLQAVPGSVETFEVDAATRSTRELYLVAVARTAGGAVVTGGTVSLQLVLIDVVDKVTVIGAAVIEASVPTGAGLVVPLGGASLCAVRLVGSTGLGTAAKLRIFARRAS